MTKENLAGVSKILSPPYQNLSSDNWYLDVEVTNKFGSYKVTICFDGSKGERSAKHVAKLVTIGTVVNIKGEDYERQN